MVGTLLASAAAGSAQFNTEIWPRDAGAKGGHVEVYVPEFVKGKWKVESFPEELQGRVLDVVLVKGTSKVDFAAGIALLEDGSIAHWGDEYGGLEDPPKLNDAIQIGAYFFSEQAFGVALRQDGSVVRWGSREFDTPRRDVRAIAVGQAHVLCLHKDGTVTSHGGKAPQPPDEVKDIEFITARFNESFAIDKAGKLFVWGNRIGKVKYETNPSDLPPLKEIATALHTATAITQDSKLIVWGDESQNGTIGGKKLNGTEATRLWFGTHKIAYQNPAGEVLNVTGIGGGAGDLSKRIKDARTISAFYPNLAIVRGERPASKPIAVAAAEPEPNPAPSPDPSAANDGDAMEIPDDAQLKKILEAFSAELQAKAGQPFLEEVAKLDQQYAAALDRKEEDAVGNGDLDLVQAVRTEKDLLKGDGIPAADAEGDVKGIRDLRSAYRTKMSALKAQRDANAADMIGLLKEQIKAREVQLTKDREIEGALAIREFSKDLPKWLASEFGLE